MSDHPKTKLRTMIVDDEPLAVERLQLICATQPQIELVGTAHDGASALRMAEQLKPELLLLDIAMPGMDGISVARNVSALPVIPAIIFVTAFDRFAVEAFDVAAVDYVLKPVEKERLARAVSRVSERRGLVESSEIPVESPWVEEFWVPHRSELRRISVAEIERVEAERDYMRLHVGQRSYLLHQTITALEARLDPEHFIRLHRSHLVRISQIAGLRHDGGGVWTAILKCGTEIRIGRTHLARAKLLTSKR